MFPLISNVMAALRQAQARCCDDVMDDLEEPQGVPFERDIGRGDDGRGAGGGDADQDRFVAGGGLPLRIGTNDLIQYTLAVDRSNREVAGLYNAGDPAILQLIHSVVSAGQAAGIPTSLCGQMSANPSFTMLLLGLGLRCLSIPPVAIPEIKQVCRRVTLTRCQAVARHALELETAMEVNDYLKREQHRAMQATADASG
jgi:phosphoenolpyruvate-protein phosphotransferase (PTS system enzyme I)